MPEPNQPLTLSKTNITNIDGHSVKVPVNVMLRMLPSPEVVFESDHLPTLLLRNVEQGNKVELENGTEIDVLLNSMNSSGSGSLIPSRQPVMALDEGRPIQSVRFSVINLSFFYGGQDKWVQAGDSKVLVPHTQMETSRWSIQIAADEGYAEIEKLLRKSRGHAITHTGVIGGKDSKAFSKEDVQTITDGLRVFLSFAHGSHVGISHVEGLDFNGEPSLIQWGPRYTAPWISRQSWCPRMAGGDVLQELFPGFWQLFTQEGWNETIRRVIDWYLQGNESRFVDSSIVFNQVALECLSHRILSGGDSKKAAGYRISKALKESGIDDSAIPESLPVLRSLSAKKGWKGGAHAITEMRNSTVHADNSSGGFSLDGCFEASALGQWYIELILLSLFGYTGKYRNRLLIRSGSYPVEDVPWVNQA
ncbi:MAG: hypothetical protein F4X57_12715 [Chloroflexi bacterium]|nr:hypothetical protein [Chloroflexota bacterium]